MPAVVGTAPAAIAAPPAAVPDAPVPTLDAFATDPADDAAAEPPAAASVAPVDIESVAARRMAMQRPLKRQQRRRLRISKLAIAGLVLAMADAALIVCRADVVRMLPQTASLFEAVGLPVNLRHLEFKDIRTAQESHDGVNILLVEGNILATGRGVAEVPRLRFAIGAGNGHEIYAWTALPTRTRLAPGETLAFRTRLASPPEQGRSVKVRFFNRLDLATGLR
jgi:hypothetical protein